MTVSTVIYTQPRGGGDPIEELPAEIIRYGYRRNRPGAIQFDLSVDHPKATVDVIDAGRHEAVVVRNGQKVWVGPVWTADEDDQKVSFGGEGLLSYLRQWHLTSTWTFTQQDQLHIARTVVASHQSKAGGDFGIVTTAGAGGGQSTSGVLRDRTYFSWDRKNIFEALTELSEVENGFDLDVDPDRNLVLYYPARKRRRDDVVFDERNVRKYGRTVDATLQASQVLAVGAGDAEQKLLADVQDSAAVAAYKLTNRIYTNTDVKVPATLVAHAQRELKLTDLPQSTIAITVGTVDPLLFSYGLGDEVKVKWPSPYRPVNEYRSLEGFDVTFERASGEEQAVLYVSELL